MSVVEFIRDSKVIVMLNVFEDAIGNDINSG